MAKKKKSSKKLAPKASKSRKQTKKSKERAIEIDLPVEIVDFYKKVAKFAGCSLNTVMLIVIGFETLADLERNKSRDNFYQKISDEEMATLVSDDRKKHNSQ